MKTLAIAIVLSTSIAHAETLDPKFFANAAVERSYPAAFALQPESQAAVRALLSTTLRQAHQLARVIRADQSLFSAIQSFARLTMDQRVPVLQKIFAYEIKSLNITAPELVIGPDVTPGSAYFDFDPDKGGTGRVLLNTKALAADKNVLTSIMLLLHETRHSAQFQFAFQPAHQNTPVAKHFAASFRAQKSLKGKLSYLDFMTLLNEYEAFQFGNYVMGVLSNFFVDTDDMGSYASQFTQLGKPKINLIELFQNFKPEAVLDQFNELEKAQYQSLKP